MPEEMPQRKREKKKEKPVEKKIMGNVRIPEEPEREKPGRPTYEHG